MGVEIRTENGITMALPAPARHPSPSSWASMGRELAGNGGKRVLGQHTCARVKNMPHQLLQLDMAG